MLHHVTLWVPDLEQWAAQCAELLRPGGYLYLCEFHPVSSCFDEDRPTLIQRAHALHDAGMKALAAIDKKDVDGLSDAGEAIDEACEQCHLKYWYPPNTPEILKKASVRKAPL